MPIRGQDNSVSTQEGLKTSSAGEYQVTVLLTADIWRTSYTTQFSVGKAAQKPAIRGLREPRIMI